MAANPSLDDVFLTTGRPRRSVNADEHQRGWWWSWEEWLTLSLVMLVQLPVVGSLQSANWVRELPSLMGPALVGLAAAWLLGHSRLSGLIVAGVTAVVGVISTLLLVMQTMELTDPLLGDGPRAHWTEFWLRLRDWGAALIEGGISADPLPFVVLLVTMVFAVAFISTWAAIRWLNPWAALVPGGFVLLTNISYLPGQPSLSFIVFVLAAVMLIARIQYLRARDRWRTEGFDPPDFMSLEVLSVGAVVAVLLVAVAWTVPTANHWGPVADVWGRALAPVTERVDRVGQLFIGVGSKKEIPVHSLGPTLPIQGKITLNTLPLLEVSTEQALNLRGAVYDEYTGSGWKVSAAAILDEPGASVESAELGTAETRAFLRQPVRADVTVVGSNVPEQRLLAAGDPLASDVTTQVLVDNAGYPLAVVPDARVTSGDSYITVGAISVASVTTLQHSGTVYPQRVFDRYTQLPPGLPPEVASLALSITAGAQTPYEAARRIESYLRANYAYSLDVRTPAPRSDAAADFLFNQQSGYFDHFSTAMVVMLRTLGVPSRIAAGFTLDPSSFDAESKVYVLSEEDAWSWPEVYFPGLGWVEFNPTPSRGLVARSGDDSAALADRDGILAGAPGDLDPLSFLLDEAELGDFFPAGDFDTAGDVLGVDESDSWLAEVIGAVIVLATIGFILIFAARLLWDHGFRGLQSSERRWAKVQRLASWAGIAPADVRTPTEAADALAGYLPERPALIALARSFTSSRYGRGEDATPEAADATERLDTDYRAVSRRLWRLVGRRVVRFGRSPAPSVTEPLLAGRYASARPRR